MKALLYVSVLGLFLITGCGKSHIAKSPKRQKTPSHMVMSQDEKVDVNYDQRENRKFISQNLKNKEANKKAADKARRKQNAELNELNQSSSKVRKKKPSHEAFSFY